MASANPPPSGGSEIKPVAKPAIKREDNRKEIEKQLFQHIKEGKDEEALALIQDSSLNVNAHDDHGLTALEFACYKKNKRLCRALLHNKANVNSHQHEHCYSALMFSALSGEADITEMMLEAGADTKFQNSVMRTSAQMAEFIGLFDIAAMIYNYKK